MGILTWIIIGGVAGWLASIIMNRNEKMGVLSNIILGVLGAFVGGWIFGRDAITGFNLISLGTALLGALVVLLIRALIERLVRR